MNPQAMLRFRTIGLWTILLVYLVIMAGSIVRASGAGMGCPDWPTCFGQWIPPTEEAQLPANYHEIYAARGYENTQFNPVKTWTEYTNRLVGVTLGLFILCMAWSSRHYLKSDKTVFFLALTTLFLVGFQGWLGSVVVASNLQPFKITLHMLLALILATLLIYTVTRSQRDFLTQLDVSALPVRLKTVLMVALVMTLVQIAMGTQVREAVDGIALAQVERQFWRADFPVLFYIHRSFSSIILFTNLWIVWSIFKQFDKQNPLFQGAVALGFVVVTGILAGVSLDRLGMPAVAQPIHLLMANLIFGTQFFLYLGLGYAGNKA
ncbi:MAG: COX15/CtaA family protein [Methylococcales bacterium]|jgi:cytochrome c oxidase assembly protein subunit 15|nr:COX15/CtaA family protein [Methylococcales bacterium]